MEKLVRASILSTVVAGLVACGGGSGGSNSTTPNTASTRLITAMDGLLYNAVVFKDSNDNLIWDVGEPLLGLTDKQGQATVMAKSTDSIGVMTLVSGSPTSLAMAQQNAQYKNISTIDMDFPNTPISQELSFVAPPSVNVLSPYTHLLSVIKHQNGVELEAAETLLEEVLGAEDFSFELKENYIQQADAQQHKIAQLLSDAMARYPADLIDNWHGFVKEAAQVTKKMSDQELNNPSFRPMIDGDTETQTINNTTIQVNEEAWRALQNQWNNIGDISAGDAGLFFSIDLNAIPVNGTAVPLYTDPDRPGQPVDYSLIDFWAHGTKQSLRFVNRLDVRIEEDGSTLTVSSDEVFKAENNDFFLVAKDYNANDELVSSMISQWKIRTSSANGAPTVSDTAQTEIQQHIDANWRLEKGQTFEQALDLSQWFSDPEGDALTYTVSGSVLEVGLSATQDQDTLTISGIPVRSFAEEGIRHTLVITAKDNHNFTPAQVELMLPEIDEGLLLESNPLVGKSWYYIDEEEDDGITKNFCRYIRFDHGKVTQTIAEVYDHNGCNRADSSTVSATSYNEVNLTTLKESMFMLTKVYTVRYAQPTDNGVAYAVTIDSYEGQNNQEVFMFYSSKEEVEQRLDIDSNQSSFEFALPVEGKIEQITVNPTVDSNSVTLSFTGNLTCKHLANHFRLNQISSNKINVFGGAGFCKNKVDGEDVDPFYHIELMSGDDFTAGEQYYIHFRYRTGSDSAFGESLKLNFVKD
ncbi:hypothetical protein [Vibrio sinaloensis]|uniref:hypothetical protein n=2 Tax=Photobacterium sp. (strain ATCC 43367) TaxID=379097 RepID=UPI002F3EEF35